MKNYRQSIQEDMVMTSKESYSIGQKLFCCKCFHCLQNEVILTTDIRRQTLQKMIKNFAIDDNDDHIEDSIKLMILIYLCPDESVPQRFINRCQINPDHSTDTYRTDLQFYIPQLCNYQVFHNELRPSYLSEAVEKASRLSFYFAHVYYFQLNSVEKIILGEEVQVFRKVTEYKRRFLEDMKRVYEGQMLNSVEYSLGEKVKTVAQKSDLDYLVRMYGHKEAWDCPDTVRPADIALPNYSSVFLPHDAPEAYSFNSTINFFEDLFACSEEVKQFEDRRARMHDILRAINKKLPACVYIPFVKDSDQYCNLLNIVVEETKLFATKSRAPYSLCLEVFDPIECISPNSSQKEHYRAKLSRPITLKRNVSSETLVNRESTAAAQTRGRKMSSQVNFGTETQTEVFGGKDSHYLTSKLLEYSNEMETQPQLYRRGREVELGKINSKEMAKRFGEMFGESEEETRERIREKSIYKDFRSWKLIHVMVKTEDNLKQEQFALQLIYQFDYIFKLEGLRLKLTPYEVLAMGPDYGIIEMLKDTITFDRLKKTLRNDFGGKEIALKEFFEIYFGEGLIEAKDNFLQSLAGYSLAMYFMQAKDRHNGNIMLHRSGKIIHIDFGFFLSNLPGKGVELEKDCPFKLLTEYIEVLDGPESYYFKKFRELLFQGFKAVRKHQDKIMMLVKMMYSSNGTTMPCFEKGEEAIRQLEMRFNPPKVHNDAHLNLHCQKLINDSLDNWATKWYDRFQYFAQGIFY